jgi:hypothetical protein
MNPFKLIFGMPKAVDAIINTGDALVFTDEERKNWLIESAKVLGPQNVARRLIAAGVTVVWVLLTLLEAGLVVFSHSKIAEYHNFYLIATVPFGGIMAFYYGTQLRREKKNG